MPVKPTVDKSSKEREPRRLRPAAARPLGVYAAALSATGSVFVLYLMTLAPTVLHYERPDLIDSAMLQTCASVLGITHPTGYPTYTLLAHLFTYLPVGDPAYRVSLASAVFAAAAVFFLFFAGLRLGGSVLAAAVGALAFGVGNTFWSQAVIAEVYTLNAAFVALVVLLLLLWRDSRADYYLLAAAFFMGLSLTNHVTSGLLLPTAALFVLATDRKKLLEKRLVLAGAGLFLLGLAPYLYLPLRAYEGTPIAEADPTSLVQFWDLVSGRQAGVLFGAYGPAEIPARLAAFWGYLLDEFNPVLLLVAAVGPLVLLFRDRAGALLLGVPCLGWVFYAIEYDIFDYYIYFIPSYLMMALFVTAGAAAVLDLAGRLAAGLGPLPRIAVPLLLAVPLLYLVLSDVREDYPLVDRSREMEGREIVESVAEKTAPGATVLHHRSPLWYMVLVEKRRRDLTLVNAWYSSHNPVRFWADPEAPPEIEYPFAEVIGGSGVAEARTAAEGGAPVYALERGVELCDFWRAGFSIVTVENGLLYELVPPGRAPYTTPEERQEAEPLSCAYQRLTATVSR